MASIEALERAAESGALKFAARVGSIAGGIAAVVAVGILTWFASELLDLRARLGTVEATLIAGVEPRLSLAERTIEAHRIDLLGVRTEALAQRFGKDDARQLEERLTRSIDRLQQQIDALRVDLRQRALLGPSSPPVTGLP